MTDAARPGPAARQAPRLRGWWARLIARPAFQDWASGFPLTRPVARRDGAAIFSMMQGFVESQALLALVELRVLHRAMDGPVSAEALGRQAGLSGDRAAILLQAGAALGLLRRRRDGRFAIARKGAAFLGVPGLEAMVRHHRAFYADMADPVALLRGEAETELAAFWPYVFGAARAEDPEVAAVYSDLMAQSQHLVAQDTLRQVSLRGVSRLFDIGGGTGAFLSAVAARYPALRLDLMDLPAVLPGAESRFARDGLTGRVTLHPGSFRDDPLPRGADAISLVRVCYDHEDATVDALLRAVHVALPPGGRLILSEPMAGGVRPERAGDLYFAFYTMAMGTGRARSQARLAEMCRAAGFVDLRTPRAGRPYVTSVVSARKPSLHACTKSVQIS